MFTKSENKAQKGAGENKQADESKDSKKEDKPAGDDKPSGLTIDTFAEHVGSDVCPGKRLWLTADKRRVVPEGDKDAATLYCTASDRVPRDEYERLVSASKSGASADDSAGE